MERQEFTIMVRLWLNHKVVLSYKSPWYKKPEVATSLRMCQDIVKMVRINCTWYDIPGICRMILINQRHLLNILPAPSNNTYQKQFDKLQQIITFAKNYNK